MVTQYDVEGYQRIEQLIGKRLPIYDVPKEAVGLLQARVYEAQRIAMQQIREEEAGAKQRTKRKNADSIDTDSRPEYAE
jgi:ATP-dependent RNA helicase DDX47/RRP3